MHVLERCPELDFDSRRTPCRSQVGSLEGNRNAGSYSENVFLLVCRSSMQLLRRPPPPFEPLIKVRAVGLLLMSTSQTAQLIPCSMNPCMPLAVCLPVLQHSGLRDTLHLWEAS